MRSGATWEKKEKHRNPHEPLDFESGDQWDHVALDVPSRLVVSLVTARRTPEALTAVVGDFAARTNQKPPRLITTDENAAYEPVLKKQYGKVEVVKRRDDQPDRRYKPRASWPDGMVYATVSKTYRRGRAVEVKRKLVHGTEQQLAAALEKSPASNEINTAFIERQNGTDRVHNSRKARKTLGFSKSLIYHLASSWWVIFCYNIHFLHRGLSLITGFDHLLGRWFRSHKTPAMAMGLTDHPWSVEEILSEQVSQLPLLSDVTPDYFRPPGFQEPLRSPNNRSP